jgi:phage replication-related protein YjqB (UPF0714/DUF867 family)
MPDRFPDFASLARESREGSDFAVRSRHRDSGVAIVAPHGGGIEPGTSEIAEAVAGDRHSFYAFEGMRARGNAELHVTSTRFDEPRMIELVTRATTVIAIHGEAGDTEGVFVGGLDAALGERMTLALRAAGFCSGAHPDAALQGADPANLCNRGAGGAGVQLEIALATRRTLFAALNRAGRRRRTARFDALVTALRAAIDPAARE